MFVRTFRHTILLGLPQWGKPLAVCILVWLLLVAIARGQPGGTGDYRVYPLKYKAAADVARIVSQMLSGQPALQVVADPSKNQLMVRGPQEIQEVVRQLLESVDQPPASAPAMRPVVKTYPCEPNRLPGAAASLRAQFSGRPDVRIADDMSTGQLLILAPPDVHDALARQFGASPASTPPSAQRPISQSVPQQIVVRSPAGPPPVGLADRPGTSAAVQQLVPAANVRAEQIELRLRDLLGPRLTPLANPQGGVFGQRLSDDEGRFVELRVDPSRNALHLIGSQPLVEQVAQLIRVLDNPRQSPEQSVSIIRLRGNSGARLRQAMGANRGGPRGQGTIPQSAMPGGPGGVVPIPTAPDANKGSYYPMPATGVTQAAHLAQAAPAPAGAPAMPPPGSQVAPPAGEDSESAVVPVNPEVERQLQEQLQRLRQLGEDVEVETLPDLDVLILRGRQRDVEEMRRIIDEIERISAEAQPIIEVYQLRHVGSAAVAQVIKEVAIDLTGARQGRASVTPLIKPNSLLLIGWGQALESVKELIAKLDRPVAPGTQLQVFRLKHSPAMAAETTIRQFLAGRRGMGTDAQVIADVRTNSLVVYASPRDLQEVALLVERLDVGQSDVVNQVRVFPLQNSLAADVAATLYAAIQGNTAGSALSPQKSAVLEMLTIDAEGSKMLKSGLLNDVTITPDVRMNTLIVSAPAESMDLLTALIKQLDSPTSVAQIKVFHIINGDANSLVVMLRALLPSQVGGATPLQLPAAEGESALTPLRFSVDIRTNTIIAVGSAGDLAIIEALLLRLDDRDLQQRRSTIIRLRNAPASDVATAVNEYLRSERTLMQAAPGTLNPFLQLEKEVVVVPEPVSNSLIVSATPRYYDDIMKLVNDLDAQPPMVLIQALIGSVDLRNVAEFGVELGLQDSLLFDRSVVTANNTLDPGFNFNNVTLGNSASSGSLATSQNVAGQALSNFNLTRVGDVGYGGLVLAASSESVSVLIRALQECRHLEVLARPQIMTLDNQPSFIQVGQRVPRISGSAINTVGQVNSIVLENVGLILGVTPRVSPEGVVVMEIDAERSELGSIDEGIPVAFSGDQVIRSPVTNLTMAQTTVSAADGETIVLGGLINKATKTTRRRVPWISEIPVLGNLFRYDSDSVQRTELLIILTPHIVRTPKDAERYKQLEATRMHWCLADVNDLHGPTGIASTQVVYPDLDPRGAKPTTVSGRQAEPGELELTPVPERVPTPTPVLPKIDFPAPDQPAASSGAATSPPPDAKKAAGGSKAGAAQQESG